MDINEGAVRLAPVARMAAQAAAADAPASGGSEGMVFNGGKVVECAYLYPVFLGSKWQDNPAYAAMAGQIQLF